MDELQKFIEIFWSFSPYQKLMGIGAILGILGWITGFFKFLGKLFKQKPETTNPVFGPADAVASVTSASVGEIAKQLVEQAGLRAHAEGRAEAAEQEITSLKNTIEEMAASPVPAMAEALAKLQDGDTEAAETLFQKIASEKEQTGAEANKQAAHAYRNLGNIAFLHDTQKALRAYAKATELDPDDPDGWNQLGTLQLRLGLLDAAIVSYEKVLSLGNRFGDKSVIATATGNLGLICRTRGDLDRAEEMHRKSLTLSEELGRKEGMANQYGNLGLIYRKRGDLDQAEEMHRKSLALSEELGRKEGMASQYGNLGLIYAARDHLDQAEEMFRKSLALEEELGRKEGMANVYANMGTLYQQKGNITTACAHWQKAKRLFTEIGMKAEIDQVEAQMRDANCPPS